jgi:hypothetical protein
VLGATPETDACWICGNPATTGEHCTKRSDLKAEFDHPTQKAPLFFHNAGRMNRRIGSLNSQALKSPARLCERCNSTRTQPFDRAWETMSRYLRENRPAPGTVIRASDVFPGNPVRQMLNLHLFWVKTFGCLIIEGNLPISICGFRDAILNVSPHPELYAKFHAPRDMPIGRSDVWTSPPAAGSARFAVNVMYAAPGEKRAGLIGCWHPQTKKTVLIAPA